MIFAALAQFRSAIRGLRTSILLEIARQARDEWNEGNRCTGAGRAIASGKAINSSGRFLRYSLSREEEDKVCCSEEEETLGL